MLDEKKLQILITEVKKAGSLAIKIRNEGLHIEKKADGSKVTNADKALDKYICDVIKNKLAFNDVIISEEEVAKGNSPTINKNESFWSIDPIDSTSSFIKGNPYYCISIAYIKNNIPIFGLIYAPDTETLWYGIVGKGAYKQVGNQEIKEIKAREPKDFGATLVSSELQKTPQEFLDKYNIREEIKLPSAIKFTLIPEGRADYYVRKRNIACDWDIAAGHALILAAGGTLTFTEPDDFQYGKPPYLGPALIATGKPKNLEI